MFQLEIRKFALGTMFGSSIPRTYPFNRDEYIIIHTSSQAPENRSFRCAPFSSKSVSTTKPLFGVVLAMCLLQATLIWWRLAYFFLSHFLGWPNPERSTLARTQLKEIWTFCAISPRVHVDMYLTCLFHQSLLVKCPGSRLEISHYI